MGFCGWAALLGIRPCAYWLISEHILCIYHSKSLRIFCRSLAAFSSVIVAPGHSPRVRWKGMCLLSRVRLIRSMK